MHELAITAMTTLASGGHGHKRIIYGVVLLVIIAAVVAWVIHARNVRKRIHKESQEKELDKRARKA